MADGIRECGTTAEEPRRIISLLEPGHTGCAGCGQALAARLVLEAVGNRVILANATGCLEVFTTQYPRSAWEVPFIHSLFENSAAVAAGIEVALKAMGREGEAKVIAQGGDGGTADIGIGTLSGAWERGHDFMYVCYDNEGYMNTGFQRSGLTPRAARTTTTPPGTFSSGNPTHKKNIPLIAVHHGVPYVATASIAYARDLQRKVKKAFSVKGPSYLQINVPCVPGWGFESKYTVEMGRLAVETGLYPIFEYEEGKLTRVRKVKERRPVEDFLKPQKRFAHLFKAGGEDIIETLRLIAEENAENYGIFDKT
ncbi:MAG: thiamine pyrophosphate-dependent enzyme [Candidatus Geothermincolia bacterium]